MLAEVLSRENLGNCESYVLRFNHRGETKEDSITLQRPIPTDQTTLDVYYLGESLILLEQDRNMAQGNQVYFERIVPVEDIKYYEDKNRFGITLGKIKGKNAGVLVNYNKKYPDGFDLVDTISESGMDFVKLKFRYDADKGSPFGKDEEGKTVWVNFVVPKSDEDEWEDRAAELEADEDDYDDQPELSAFLKELHSDNGGDGDEDEDEPRSRRSRKSSKGSKSSKSTRSERGSGRKGSKSSSGGDDTKAKITEFVELIAHGLEELEAADVELSDQAQASFVGTIAHML